MADKGHSRRNLGLIGAVGVVALGALVYLQHTSWYLEQSNEPWTVVETYCERCHNSTDRAGDILFNRMSPDSVPTEAAIFETAVKKLRGRLMPPPGNRQPDR